MKDHTSHDVLLLCPRCHQLSNASDLLIREKLARECDAPLSSKEATKKIDVPRLRYVPKFIWKKKINGVASTQISEKGAMLRQLGFPLIFFLIHVFPYTLNSELKSISRALLKQRDHIPERRLDELKTRFFELCPDEKEITDELLQSFINIETTWVEP